MFTFFPPLFLVFFSHLCVFCMQPHCNYVSNGSFIVYLIASVSLGVKMFMLLLDLWVCLTQLLIAIWGWDLRGAGWDLMRKLPLLVWAIRISNFVVFYWSTFEIWQTTCTRTIEFFLLSYGVLVLDWTRDEC